MGAALRGVVSAQAQDQALLLRVPPPDGLSAAEKGEEMTYYKVLGKGRKCSYGGVGTWPKPGVWTKPVDGKLVPCKNGYHVLKREQLVLWLGSEIWEVEPDAEIIEDNDKCVTRRARLVNRLETWNEKTARLFAADCAEHVLPIWTKLYPRDKRPELAIKAARDFAQGKINKTDLTAAGAAAWDAARDAAGTAERAWQTERLLWYLGGKK